MQIKVLCAHGTDLRNAQLWKEDIELLETHQSNAYRLSISWSRVIPKGGRQDPLKEKGSEYCDKVIDALLEKGNTPFVVSTIRAHPRDIPAQKSEFRRSIIGMSALTGVIRIMALKQDGLNLT
jgi:hypothetical protein